jgi:hypothetical protein
MGHAGDGGFGGGGSQADSTGDTQGGDRDDREKKQQKPKPKPAPAPVPAPASTPAPAPTPAPTPEPVVPTPVATAFKGAINRSSGDTGTAALNQGAVTRARQVGTPIGKLVSSIDGSRPRSILGGIVKKSGSILGDLGGTVKKGSDLDNIDLTRTKVVDASGL